MSELDTRLAAALSRERTIEEEDQLIERGREISLSGEYDPEHVPYVEKPYRPPVFADVEALNKAHRRRQRQAFGR